jgi:hypothetical protein
VTPLAGNTESARRVPTLVAVVEMRDAEPRGTVEPGPLPELVELPGEEVEEPLEAEEAPEEIVEIAAPPVQCPFCFVAFRGGCIERGKNRHYYCANCSGAVHYRGDGKGVCSVLKDGRRHTYGLRRGRPEPGVHVRPAPAPRAEPVFRRTEPAFGAEVVPGAPRPYSKMRPAFGAGVVKPPPPRPLTLPRPIRPPPTAGREP